MVNVDSREIISIFIKFRNNCLSLDANIVTLLCVISMTTSQSFSKKESFQIQITVKLLFLKLQNYNGFVYCQSLLRVGTQENSTYLSCNQHKNPLIFVTAEYIHNKVLPPAVTQIA